MAIVIDTTKNAARALLMLSAAAVFVFIWLAVRWQIGDMFAEYTLPNDQFAGDIAANALALSPGNARAHWLAAAAATTTFSTESIDKASELLGQAVKLCPGDYRWWIQYGRYLEQAGHESEAEAALNRAVDLAPNYGHPHWQLANLYLRQGNERSLEQFTLAAAKQSPYRSQTFALVWANFGQDEKVLDRVAPATADGKADLALFYGYRGRVADALRVWNSIADSDREKFSYHLNELRRTSAQTAQLREALEFSHLEKKDTDAKPDAVTNAGFESVIDADADSYFDWKFDRENALDIAPDPSVRHLGNRSLRISFKNFDGPQINKPAQNIVVAANAKYTLSFWVRTESLRSGGPPRFDIVNEPDGKLLAVSAAFPSGTNEWTQVSIPFTTPDNSEGITIRLSRESCGETCPIVGNIWLDDFDLIRG